MADTAVTLLTPGNNSGVLGLARATLDGTTLTMDLVAANLTPGQVHPLHIHGFLDDRAERLAVAADDTDGDGFVETPEGEASAYGPVIAGLTASGDAQFGLELSTEFPTAAADGTLRLSQTYTLDPTADAEILERLNARFAGRVLEFHGIDLAAGAGAGTPNEADGAGGYNPQLPVAQGPLLVPDAATLAAIDPRTAGWLAADSATFLDRGAAALSLLAPYTLNQAGTGPVAPEPQGAATPATSTFAALLAPSNGSGALGLSLVQIDQANSSVTVNLWMTGLEPGQEHASHIHGFADDRPSLLPNLRLDADLDGFVEDSEGEPVVGPTILALTEDGTVSNATLGVDFPDADANGRIRLTQTYDFDTVDPTQAAIFAELTQRLAGREVQVHGLTLPATEGEGTPGEVDGTAGYKAGLPVANGILLPVTDAAAAQDLVALGNSLEALLASTGGGGGTTGPLFAVTRGGTASQEAGTVYTGPVASLQFQFLGTDAGEAARGTASNDFINMLGGDDAVDGGAGDDVLDGGLGSNFLTGGAGDDVFFIDGRGGQTTWSTITDWQQGEQLSLFGWRPGVSRGTFVDNGGAPGFTGVTWHGDLNGDGAIETSVTWAGVTRADLPLPVEFSDLLWFV
jgi:hypothetical protein